MVKDKIGTPAKRGIVERLDIDRTERFSGLHRGTMWRRYSAEPPTFPRPHYIGLRRYWFAHELEAWAAAEMARPPEELSFTRNLKPGGGFKKRGSR